MSTYRHALSVALSAVALVIPLRTMVYAIDGQADQAAPVVSIHGGSAQHRQTVRGAIARFEQSGLRLPDLDIRIHDDKTGCEGKQGLFHRTEPIGVIDLCYPGEFLALHELGHAWEHLNLDDDDRLAFMKLTGAPTWRSTDVVWRKRGAERAANVIANGLLSAPLDSVESHRVWFAQFQALTGITSPRVNEVVLRPRADESPTAEEASRLSAYEAWRATTE